MTSSEIAFLALGLVLGAALGAALVQVVRARPAPRREVRLTITQNAIPARTGPPRSQDPATPGARAIEPGGLAAARPAGVPAATAVPAAPAATHPDPAPGPAQPAAARTRVPSAGVVLPSTVVAVPVGEPSPAPAANGTRDMRPQEAPPRPPQNPGPHASASAGPAVALAAGAATAIAVLDAPRRPSADIAWRPLDTRPGAFTTLVRPRASAQPPADPGGSAGPVAASAAGTPGASAAGTPGASADPCSAQRRAVDERCALADVAREQARRVADALREAQRAYDVLRDRVDRAELEADPREVAAAKERLHSAFRAASGRAGTAEETEAAARAWLNEINARNNAVREAQRTVEAGTAELRSRIGALERLSAEADAARIAGENAEGGCHEARVELAGCEEAQARARDAVPPEPEEPHPFDKMWPEDRPDLPPPAAPADLLAGLPLVVRVLGGDRDARERIVAMLAAGDAEAARDWGLRISRLTDAITGRAIEDGYLDLPDGDPFWRLFSPRERRDIVGALSSLGFRYDGLGGFADGRSPAARDLSLAVGYAGLEAMRIRTWPRESEIAVMYEGAVVVAAEWLADLAGDLSLSPMVDALGSRAADLADVWNAWGRVRPALLST